MSETKANPTRTYHITGMDCADCARSVERGVSRLDGADEVMLNFSMGTLRLQGEVSDDEVVARVRELGYDVAEEGADGRGAEDAREPRKKGVAGFIQFLLQRRDTTLALIALVLILPGVLFNELLPMLGLDHWIFNVTSILAWLLAGYPIARSAWRSITINHQININVLMTIAAAGAVVIGAYTEAGLVMVLFALGEALEGYTASQARDSIRSLMELAPADATVLGPCIDCKEHLGKDGYTGGPCPYCGLEEQQVPVENIQIGEIILVKPGERLPMDGIVTAGQSGVDQAPITGESNPVEKTEGSDVFAGSINGEGVLQIEVTHLADDNTISRMIRMVEDAQEQQAPSQRFVDRFATYYTPAVVVLALLVAVIPPLIFDQPFWDPASTEQGWLYRALTLLVVACPCALVISTPVSLISAISNAARHGVLIKGGAYLESLYKVKAIAFDKTGTLTAGRPQLVRVRAVDCIDPTIDCADEGVAFCDPCEDLLALVSTVERRSEHPLGRAIVQASEGRGLLQRYPAPTDVYALAGRGVSGSVDGRDILIGSHTYFEQQISHLAHCADIGVAATQGQTPMLVSVDGEYQGYLTVTDTVRESSRTAIAELKDLGIEELVMLTGDDDVIARRIGEEVGVTDVRANLLPEQKVDAVQALLDEYDAVAMVGDGINDAPALATATVGIAMGAAGTAQAMETADIALMNDEIDKLPFAVRLSRATMHTIYANVAFAIGIKIIFLLLIMFGYGSMWLAVFADVGASLLVTLNGMRLLKRPAP